MRKPRITPKRAARWRKLERQLRLMGESSQAVAFAADAFAVSLLPLAAAVLELARRRRSARLR